MFSEDDGAWCVVYATHLRLATVTVAGSYQMVLHLTIEPEQPLITWLVGRHGVEANNKIHKYNCDCG